MLRPLPTTLFEVGKPLRAAGWNTLVDASAELVDVWGAEHVDGARHAAARLESAAILLEWIGGDWGAIEQDRVKLAATVPLAGRFEVHLEFSDVSFLSRFDYAVLAQGDDGVPCIVPQATKAPEGFVLIVPDGSSAQAPSKIAVVVYGRERGAE